MVLQDEIHRLSRLSQDFRRHGIGGKNQLFQTRRTRGVVVDADVVIDDGIGRIAGNTQSERSQKAVFQSNKGKLVFGGKSTRFVCRRAQTPSDNSLCTFSVFADMKLRQ